VALILAVKREMERGAAAATAWQRVLAAKPHCTPCPAIRSPEWLSGSLVSALLTFDADESLALLAEAHAVYPLERVLAGIIQPALATIGDRWHLGEATVAQEHFATQLVRDSLALMGRAYRPRQGAETVVVGAAPGERHEIGALTLSLLLRRGGHRVIYLGQDVALEGLGAAIVQTRARMLLLSAARRETAQALAAVPGVLEGIEPRPHFVFGGRIFAQQPDLATQIDGIYIQGDAATAAVRLDELLAGPG
jgi:methanogenic corrinoid protein MtbC1